MTFIVSLEHAPYEDPAHICEWAIKSGYTLKCVHLWENEQLPDPSSVRLLIIMGGPMNIYEENTYPWLIREKKFIRDIINRNIPVIGICLGAQLISDVLGGAVTRAQSPEKGWYTITSMKDQRGKIPMGFPLLPELTVFQWHQDTFSIPEGSVHLYNSETCENQGYLYKDRVIGLQFHPELTEKSIRLFLDEIRNELIETGEEQIINSVLSRIDLFSEGNSYVDDLLNYLMTYTE